MSYSTPGQKKMGTHSYSLVIYECIIERDSSIKYLDIFIDSN